MKPGSRKSRYAVPALLVFFTAGSLLLNAQAPVYKPGEYPAPRYPKLPKNPTVEDLMPTDTSQIDKFCACHGYCLRGLSGYSKIFVDYEWFAGPDKPTGNKWDR